MVRIIKSKQTFQIGLPKGNTDEFETYNDAWQYITVLLMNDDLIWVGSILKTKKWFTSRKVSSHNSK